MKKFLLIAILSIFFSFQKAENGFIGFGELKIGANVNSISNLKDFKKIGADVYSIKYYKLTEEIGLVENLYLKLHENKIYQVSFSCYEGTNAKPIESIITKMEESVLTKNRQTLATQVNIFQSDDKKLTFTKTTFVNKTVDYMYFDTEINNIKVQKKKSNAR